MRVLTKLIPLLIIAFAVNSFAVSPKSKRAFTIDDLYALKTLSGLTVSSDGKKIAFVLTEKDYKKGEENSHIYLLNTENGEIRKFTSSDKSEFSPKFSPDGKYLYFLSDRQKGVQVWRIPLSGGEAERLTDFSMGVNSFAVLPNGDIVFSSKIYLEAGADSDKNKKLDEKMKKGPVQAHYADSLLYRHWTSYRDFKYSKLIKYSVKDRKYSLLTGEKDKFDYPAYGGNFDISPDGKYAVITVKFVKNPESSTNNDLYLLNLETGKGKVITEDNKAYDGGGKFSPDGKYIAYKLQKVPGYESDRFRLAVYNIETGKTEILTENIDNWVNSFYWGEKSDKIYFTLLEKGYTPLLSVNVKTGKIKRIKEKIYARQFVIAGNKAFALLSSVGKPYEIHSIDLKKGKEKRISFFNKKIEDQVDIRPAEQVWVKGADGANIHLFIIKPHNFDPNKKYPLILNVHGGPQYMWADSFRGDWQIYPAKGYIVAFPNPHGSTGYGQEFTKAISRDYTGKVMEDIEKVTEYLAKLPYVDKDRMGAMGWSWGGYAMMWLEGHNKHFKCLVAMMGLYDLPSWYGSTEELWFPNYDCGGAPWEKEEYYKKASPSSYVKNFKIPCLVITGEKDYRVPYTQSLQFFTALQEMGVPSELIIFKNDGHWPDDVKSMPVYYNAHLEWFHKWLKGGKAPYKTVDMIRNLAYQEED